MIRHWRGKPASRSLLPAAGLESSPRTFSNDTSEEQLLPRMGFVHLKSPVVAHRRLSEGQTKNYSSVPFRPERWRYEFDRSGALAMTILGTFHAEGQVAHRRR